MKFSFLYMLFILYFTITSSIQLESELRKKKNRKRMRSSLRRFENSIKYPMETLNTNDDMTMNYMKPSDYSSALYHNEIKKNEYINLMQKSEKFTDRSKENDSINVNYVKGTPGKTSPVFESIQYKTVSKNYYEPSFDESDTNFLKINEKILDKNRNENKASGLVFSSNQMEEDSTTTYRKAIVLGELNSTTNTHDDLSKDNFSDRSSKVIANAHENKTDYYVPYIMNELNKTINRIIPTTSAELENFKENIKNKTHPSLNSFQLNNSNFNYNTKSSNLLNQSHNVHAEILTKILSDIKKVFSDMNGVNYSKSFEEDDHVIDVIIKSHDRNEHKENRVNYTYEKVAKNSFAVVDLINNQNHTEIKTINKLEKEFTHPKYEFRKLSEDKTFFKKEILKLDNLPNTNSNYSKINSEKEKENVTAMISKIINKSQGVNENNDKNKKLKIKNIEKTEIKSDNFLHHHIERITPKVEMNLNQTVLNGHLNENIQSINSTLKIQDRILKKSVELTGNLEKTKTQPENLLKKTTESDSIKKSDDEANNKSISYNNKISEKPRSTMQTILLNKTEVANKTTTSLPHLFDMFNDNFIKTFEKNNIKSETNPISVNSGSHPQAENIITNSNTKNESKNSQSNLPKQQKEEQLSKTVVAELHSYSSNDESNYKENDSKNKAIKPNVLSKTKPLKDNKKEESEDIQSSSIKLNEKSYSNNLNKEKPNSKRENKNKFEINPKFVTETSEYNSINKELNLDLKSQPLTPQSHQNNKSESKPSTIISDFHLTEVLSDKKESMITPETKEKLTQPESLKVNSNFISRKRLEINPIPNIDVPHDKTKKFPEPPKTLNLSENQKSSIPHKETSTSPYINNFIINQANQSELKNLSQNLEKIKMITQKIESRKKSLIKDRNIRKNSHKYFSLTDEFLGNAYDDENNNDNDISEKIEENDINTNRSEDLQGHKIENDSINLKKTNFNSRSSENITTTDTNQKEKIENSSESKSDNKTNTNKEITEKEEIDDNSLISEFLSKKKK